MYLSSGDVDKLISKETNNIWNTGGLEFLVNALLEEFAQAGIELNDNQSKLLVRSAELLAKSITKNTLGATLNTLGQLNLLQTED